MPSSRSILDRRSMRTLLLSTRPRRCYNSSTTILLQPVVTIAATPKTTLTSYPTSLRKHISVFVNTF
ncbi:hypothetical protein H0H87_005983, partial [Tephrocybe sp. NHM501043]